MLDLKLLQSEPDRVARALERRGSTLSMQEFLALDGCRRALLTEVEALKSERNAASVEVARCKREKEDASALLERLSSLSGQIKELDQKVAEAVQAVREWTLGVPNIPHDSVPAGQDEHDNPVLREWGERPVFDFPVLDHVELGSRLGGLDFERAAKLTGARFTVYWGWAARLERALIAFMLDLHTQGHGYSEVMPPVIVNRASMIGTGQLPKFEEDLFRLKDSEYYLIPTAEVPVTNLHRDEIVDAARLPLAYAAHTLCFRSEAGSYGKDTRGLVRQHQFNKVELVRFVHPDSSYAELELLLGHAETVLQSLKLPYRVVTLCTGDLGFSAAKTYDIEVWLPAQKKYREISSCSNFVDFQSRRANIRFKATGEKKAEFLHTLNGSGLAVGRTMVAILENYQQADGSLVIPAVLRPYMGGVEGIEAAMKPK